MAVNSISTLLTPHTLLADGGVITFGFGSGREQISLAAQKNVRYILENLIAPFIDVDFIEIEGNGDINFRLHDDDDYYAYEQDHDIFLARTYDNFDGTNGFKNGAGSHGFMSIIHEVLHSMGLKHPGNYADGLDGGPFLPYELDNTTNTVMSYNFAGDAAAMPMLYDIDALRYLYGTSKVGRGKTTYKFTSVHSFEDGKRSWGKRNKASKLTLVDDGGYDTLDFSALVANGGGYTLDARKGGIFTTSGAFNSTEYQPVDISASNLSMETTSHYGTRLSFGTTIERLIATRSKDLIVAGRRTRAIEAGGGNDTVYGSGAKNFILGGAGNDQIWGEGGSDELWGGFDNDWLYGGIGRDELWGDEGDDWLYGQKHGDALFGGEGDDWLIGTDAIRSGDKDELTGGAGRDWFVLGNEEGAFYRGSGFAKIKDWEAGLDTIQLGLDREQFSLGMRNISGGAALDTAIYLGKDLIAIVEDSTEISLAGNDFVFV